MTCEHCPWAYGGAYDENDKLAASGLFTARWRMQ